MERDAKKRCGKIYNHGARPSPKSLEIKKMNLTPDNKFEALKVRYEEQAELLKFMKQNEFRLLFGYLTVQLVLSGWVTKSVINPGIISLIGITLVNLAIAISITVMLIDYKRRREEIITTIKTIMEVFGFYEAFVDQGL